MQAWTETGVSQPQGGKGKGKGKGKGAPPVKRELSKKQKRYVRDLAPSDEENDEEEVMPAAMQRKIAGQARLQQDEVEASRPARARDSRPSGAGTAGGGRNGGGRGGGGGDSDDDDDDDDGFGDDDDEAAELEGAGEYYEEVEELELGEDDERALDVLMGGGQPTRTLADVIMAKIHEREALVAAGGEGGDDGEIDLPPKVVEVYTSVGKVLSRYRSGKLPKAFKIVPRLANWEEVLYATDPDGWTPAATSEATRLFASNLNHKMAQRFFNLVLLPAVQRDIEEKGKLNFHLCVTPSRQALDQPYVRPARSSDHTSIHPCQTPCSILACRLPPISPLSHPNLITISPLSRSPGSERLLRSYLALKRALYKPSAFFKGLLLPMCEGRCTVREALIVGSVLQKVHAPTARAHCTRTLHAPAARARCMRTLYSMAWRAPMHPHTHSMARPAAPVTTK